MRRAVVVVIVVVVVVVIVVVVVVVAMMIVEHVSWITSVALSPPIQHNSVNYCERLHSKNIVHWN